jgi:hypothetical protein
VDPEAGLPIVTPTVSNALLVGASASTAQIGFDIHTTVALAGGVDLGLVVGLPEGSRVAIDLPPLILPPGHSFGLEVPFSAEADFTASLYWIEVPG